MRKIFRKQVSLRKRRQVVRQTNAGKNISVCPLKAYLYLHCLRCNSLSYFLLLHFLRSDSLLCSAIHCLHIVAKLAAWRMSHRTIRCRACIANTQYANAHHTCTCTNALFHPNHLLHFAYAQSIAVHPAVNICARLRCLPRLRLCHSFCLSHKAYSYQKHTPKPCVHVVGYVTA